MKTCMVCGQPAILTPALFPGAPDAWRCPACGATGIVSHAEPEPEPAPEREDERLADEATT